MYLIFKRRVILGIDGFIRDRDLGTQIRIWCFGLNMWWAFGDGDKTGNGFEIYLGFPSFYKII